MTELELMTEGVFKAVNEYVERRLGPLIARVAELEARPPPKDGERGEKGDAGEKGDPGIGEKGERGEKGDDGKNAEAGPMLEYLAQELNKKLILAVAELPKPKDGERGEKGEAGENGEAGKSIDMEQMLVHIGNAVEATIAMLPPAMDGKDGKDALPAKDGEKGDRGDDGLNGRDALEIEPLSSIDFNRAYARRTYALHEGGLWICRRSQPGKESWECVVSGVASIDLHQHPEDERCISLQVTKSDGEHVVRQVSLPVMLYRGVWKPGSYEHGDVTTRNGSAWCAMKDTEAEPGAPGAEDEWKMIVRKGDRGHDAEGAPTFSKRVVRVK